MLVVLTAAVACGRDCGLQDFVLTVSVSDDVKCDSVAVYVTDTLYGGRAHLLATVALNDGTAVITGQVRGETPACLVMDNHVERPLPVVLHAGSPVFTFTRDRWRVEHSAPNARLARAIASRADLLQHRQRVARQYVNAAAAQQLDSVTDIALWQRDSVLAAALNQLNNEK